MCNMDIIQRKTAAVNAFFFCVFLFQQSNGGLKKADILFGQSGYINGIVPFVLDAEQIIGGYAENSCDFL